ncbi:PKD domain-containing protein [Flavobacterium sp. N2013]|nr:PKD domain-containing protein [Flavobacterium sp. N2013]
MRAYSFSKSYNQVIPPPSSPIVVSSNSVCLNATQPIVTFTASTANLPLNFVYTINGGPALTVSSSTAIVTVGVPTDVAGVFVYKLLSYIDAAGTVTSVNESATVTVNPLPFPNTQINGTGKFDFDGSTVFKICGNTASEFEFVNASTTVGTNTSYTIDWGDGTTETLNSWTSKKHTYNVGYYTLLYTVTNSAGCSATQTYKVFLGSNPAVGFTAALNADICVGQTLSFPLSGTINNPPGTTYEVSFSDGTDIERYTQANLPTQITHKFDKNSCGSTYVSGSSSIPNSFSGTVKAINPCGTAVVSVGPIFVSSPPKAKITADSNSCLNQSICIQNTSIGSIEVTSGNASCNSTPATVWTITPSTGYTLPSGSTLGKDYGSDIIGLWDKGTAIICPTFTVAGTYTIKMRVGNRCGVSETTTTITVDVPLVPSFSLDTTVGCSPLALNATNSTLNTNITAVPSYLWTVSYTKGICGIETPVWSYTNSTDDKSKNPSYNFETSGIYIIQLSAINVCGKVTSLSQEVKVNKKPEVSINSISSICQEKEGVAVVVHPTATVNNCTSTGSMSYAWSFPGGTPATSTDENPTVSYLPGTYIISLSITNECGIAVAENRELIIAPIPSFVVTNPSPVCAPKVVDLLDASVTTGSESNLDYTYWKDNNATSSLVKPYQISVSGTYYIKATHKLTGCSILKPVEVIVNPITTITGDLEMCLGGTAVQLQTNPVNTLVASWASTDTSVATISDSGLINSVAVGRTDIIYTDNKGCQSSKTFYVNPLVTIKKQPKTTQSICVGGTIAPLEVDYNGGAGTPIYQWYVNTINSNIGGTLIPSATTLSYTPPAFTTVGKFYYYAVISLSSSGCGIARSNPAEVIVVDNISVTNQPVLAQTLCRDTGAHELKVSVSGGAGTSYQYQWYKNTTNSITGARKIPFEEFENYIPPTIDIGEVYYYCSITQINKGCEVISQLAKIEIVLPPTISEQPLSGGICLDAIAKDLKVSYSNGAGTPQYQWYSNTIDSNESGILIAGATNSNFIPPSNVLGKKYYYCVISFLDSGCNKITSNTAQIIVSTYPIIGSIETISCSGEKILVIPSESSGNVIPSGTTYTWTYPQISSTNITGAQMVSIVQENFQQNLINSGLTSANAVYTVTPNAKGCIGADFKLTVTVNPEIKVNVVTSSIKCSGTNNASIALNITGGTAPYQTTWSNLGGGVSQDNLAAGEYQVSVTDSKNCIKNVTITIPEPPLFRIDTAVKEISCHGANNGSITVAIIGGQSPIQLVWEDSPLAGKDRNNLKPGIYKVSVTDASKCTLTKSFLLVDPQELVLTANTIDAFDCTNANSGSINLLVAGGTAPFLYQWSNGAQTEDLTDLSAGNYSVTVTDSRGCVKQEYYSVMRQDPIDIKVNTKNEFDCTNRLVSQIFVAEASGGIPPFSYNWLSGKVSRLNNEIMTTNQNGIVVLKVQDGLGCESNYSLNLKIPILGYPNFTTSSIGLSTYGIYSIKDPIEFVDNSTGDFESVTWDFGDGSVSTESSPKHSYLKEGTYTIIQTVKYPFGCNYSYTTTIKVDKGYEVVVPNAFTPNNNRLNDNFKPVFKGLSTIKIEVFNKWGGLLYSEEGTSLQGWTGEINNRFVESGNYYYKVIATTFYGDEVEYNGPFILVR